MRSGTGFVLDKGYIVTNYHVIADAEVATVFGGDVMAKAVVVGINPARRALYGFGGYRGTSDHAAGARDLPACGAKVTALRALLEQANPSLLQNKVGLWSLTAPEPVHLD